MGEKISYMSSPLCTRYSMYIYIPSLKPTAECIALHNL